jgi:hypothetical protein
LPFRPSLGSVGTGMSAGNGTSQFGGDQTRPCGFSVLRKSWQDARAMAAPPLKKSASITRIRRPSRTSLVLISIGARVGSRNMSTVNRAGTKSSAPWRCSIAKANRPMMNRPCSELGSHGPRVASVGM